ncbi:Flp family type IVb pilin [Virgibacillus litoralis]|uniref:Pilus assembly protein Flp/PilA n=1 Tax=Virgibacillus litoralis TaxID=578221 RepID=A0ABS4HAX0_9BACI|nr:Flp family type IVb pilin [Virgibacillus litoralis]MBP1948069.1 pilus assembly protein Flp/PilA [Virgibacillus litoralis]
MLDKLKGLFIEEEGQGMVEYGLILGLIAVVVITLLTTLGTEIEALFQSLVDTLQGEV